MPLDSFIGSSFVGQLAIGRGSTADRPGAPTIGTLTDLGNGALRVTFTPNASNGGLPVTYFRATSSAGGVHADGTVSPIDIPGVVDTVPQTVTLIAHNAAGDSDASAASNSVTPHNTSVATRLVQATYLPTDVVGTKGCQPYRIVSNAAVAVGAKIVAGFNSIPGISNAWSLLVSAPPTDADGSSAMFLLFDGFTDALGNTKDAIEFNTPRVFQLDTCTLCKLAHFASTDRLSGGGLITAPSYQLFDLSGVAYGAPVSGAAIVSLASLGIVNGFVTNVIVPRDAYGGGQMEIRWSDGDTPPKYYRDLVIAPPPLTTRTIGSSRGGGIFDAGFQS